MCLKDSKITETVLERKDIECEYGKKEKVNLKKMQKYAIIMLSFQDIIVRKRKKQN